MDQRFLAFFDLHFGKERRGGKLVELHDPRALQAMLAFAQDFKPHKIVLGGDILDCGAVSHHNKGKPRKGEGLRLLGDFDRAKRELIGPLQALGAEHHIYHIGNHEAWIDQMIDEDPGIEGLVELSKGLELKYPLWHVREQGDVSKIGKLHFAHGDQIRSSMHPAKWAVETYERSIRFGHFHRAQLHTKISALDASDIRTGMAVPAMCRRDPTYGRGTPNQWAVGFLWGYFFKDGSFSDYLTFIVNNRFAANGKVYKG